MILFESVKLREYTRLQKWWSGSSNTNVRSVSLLVEDNLRSPVLALWQPEASLRAEENEVLEIAYNGRRRVNALEEKSAE